MKRVIHHDIYIGLLMALVSIAAYIESLKMPKGSGQFPRMILIVFLVFGLCILFLGIKKTISLSKDNYDNMKSSDKPLALKELKSPFISLAAVIAYAILIDFLGFFAATTLFLIGFMYYLKVKSWKLIFLNTLGINLFIYLLFILQLKLPLPKGILF